MNFFVISYSGNLKINTEVVNNCISEMYLMNSVKGETYNPNYLLSVNNDSNLLYCFSNRVVVNIYVSNRL